MLKILRPGRPAEAPPGSIKIGRNTDNDIVINDVLASRHHATLVTTATGTEIRDNLEARIIEAKREGWLDVAKPATRFRDLGSDYHTNRVTTQRRLRNHIAQLTAMGYQVTLEPAA